MQIVIIVMRTVISIHALLAESDAGHPVDGCRRVHFYPRSPCGERPPNRNLCQRNRTFLSTLSLRRATRNTVRVMLRHKHFYPRSPCGERQRSMGMEIKRKLFLSTLSLRRATLSRAFCSSDIKISIHALLAESDKGLWVWR